MFNISRLIIQNNTNVQIKINLQQLFVIKHCFYLYIELYYSSDVHCKHIQQ